MHCQSCFFRLLFIQDHFFFLNPRISMQNEDVNAVNAPSALGNKADIKPNDKNDRNE